MKITYLLGTGLAFLGLIACQGKEDTSNTETDPEITSSKIVAAEVPRNPLKEAYFGDLHVHTRNSFDAFIFGTRATPDDAYRFAKGETIDNGAGHKITLSGPPLDFYSVTDHGEYLGIVPAMATPGTPLSKTETAQSIFGLTATDRRQSFLNVGLTIVSGEEIEEIFDREHMNSVWAATVESTNKHYEPGKFTTFAGYEFTAMEQITDNGAINLHRNVIFKNTAPEQLFSTLDSPNPEDLWEWMNTQRAAGMDVLAIPHNSNASNGKMFSGLPSDETYTINRAFNEPLVEITQLKGTSETHPLLSPNDEWADFEQYEYLIGSTDKSDVAAGSFVRTALSEGIKYKKNPYAFGFIGSSDTHIGAPSLSEETHFGKFPHDMSPQARQSTPPDGAVSWDGVETGELDLIATPQYGASGLAGVWAEANTREDLFAAMRARETFGTSGPRLRIRMFMGDYARDITTAPDMVERAYAGGVPMGQYVSHTDETRDILVWATQDPEGMSLQRLQIIKVWNDNGVHQEKIYDVACPGEATPHPVTHRCPDNGAVVDLTTCGTNPQTGATELKAVWQDPDFVSGERTAYYARVLENPKCRWSTWDAIRNGTPPNPEMKSTVQDRAWGSPIWIGNSEPVTPP